MQVAAPAFAPYIRPCMLRQLPTLVLGLVFTATAVRATEPVLPRMPAGPVSESLQSELTTLESTGRKSATAGAAAFELGQLYEAQSNYRFAADAFGRAAARLTGDDRARARYRQGVAWLGV